VAGKKKKELTEEQQKKRRRRRRIGWTAFLSVLIILAVVAAPYIGDLRRLMNLPKPDTETAAAVAARAAGSLVAGQISDEGIVLLMNTDGFLPLSAGSKVNVFTVAAGNIRLGGSGSGGSDGTEAATLYEGLERAGIACNGELHAMYADQFGEGEQSSMPGFASVVTSLFSDLDEPAPDYLTQEILSQAKAFSDTALVVFGADAVESADCKPEQLRLSENKRALLGILSDNFRNIIVVINSGNAMELGFLEEYPAIRAALWIGTPGPAGCISLGKILSGEVNPSGRLPDTWAFDISSAPAAENFGDFRYDNLSMAFLNYEEGIYVGYRWYETYYKDDEAGYRKAVQFPFGYGLSYTTFDWAAQDARIDGEEISVEVTVTNTGAAAGKDVVQLYVCAPYIPGGAEKSAVVLAAYAKTKLLAPGESETLRLSAALRDLASYDTQAGAWRLDAGEYRMRLGANVHDTVREESFSVPETVLYRTDGATGMAVENRFGFADGGLTWLSRSDWQGTAPGGADTNTKASEELLAAYGNFRNPEKAQGELPLTGEENGILLSHLKGLDYGDPLWESFLDQFTLEEMKALVLDGAYQTQAVERLGVEGTQLRDGPAGLNSFFSSMTAAAYPTEVVAAATWNDELAYALGEAVGKEAAVYGITGWYAPGMNLHRTAQGGRNFEYFSEDPLLSGKMGAAMIRGARDQGMLVFMKHFLLNEQETNARSGMFVWANEQAIRELYLRPFEIAVKEGGVNAVMTSFIHLGYQWSGGCPALLEEVLRGEWGFRGVVTTDAMVRSYMDINLAIRGGTDLMLTIFLSRNSRYFDRLYRADPAGMTLGLRRCAHNICHALVNTRG